MFAYCENDPVNASDPTGELAFCFGWCLSGTLGPGISYALQLAFDSHGNIAIIGTSAKVAGTTNASATRLITLSNADTIDDLRGKSYSMGGSAGEGISIGGDIAYGTSPNTGKATVSLSAAAGIGAIPAELHVANNNTHILFSMNLVKTARHFLSKKALRRRGVVRNRRSRLGRLTRNTNYRWNSKKR